MVANIGPLTTISLPTLYLQRLACQRHGVELLPDLKRGVFDFLSDHCFDRPRVAGIADLHIGLVFTSNLS